METIDELLVEALAAAERFWLERELRIMNLFDLRLLSLYNGAIGAGERPGRK